MKSAGFALAPLLLLAAGVLVLLLGADLQPVQSFSRFHSFHELCALSLESPAHSSLIEPEMLGSQHCGSNQPHSKISNSSQHNQGVPSYTAGQTGAQKSRRSRPHPRKRSSAPTD